MKHNPELFLDYNQILKILLLDPKSFLMIINTPLNMYYKINKLATAPFQSNSSILSWKSLFFLKKMDPSVFISPLYQSIGSRFIQLQHSNYVFLSRVMESFYTRSPSTSQRQIKKIRLSSLFPTQELLSCYYQFLDGDILIHLPIYLYMN